MEFDGEGGDQPVVVGDGRGDGRVEALVGPVLRVGGLPEVEPSQTEACTRILTLG